MNTIMRRHLLRFVNEQRGIFLLRNINDCLSIVRCSDLYI